jgi:hypothetical protein
MRKWNETNAERFVLFADILGFKELVNSEKHENIVLKLEKILDAIEFISGDRSHNVMKDLLPNLKKNQTRAVSFSDSIIVFSEGNTIVDASKILADAHAIMHISLEANIPIKGSISFGEVTVDFEKSLFFGQPIIDSYLLHEDLSLLSIIIDHKAENQLNSYIEEIYNYENLVTNYEVPMKFGKVNHKLIRPTNFTLKDRINGIKHLYSGTSGKPRIYLDNTLKFWESLIEK